MRQRPLTAVQPREKLRTKPVIMPRVQIMKITWIASAKIGKLRYSSKHTSLPKAQRALIQKVQEYWINEDLTAQDAKFITNHLNDTTSTIAIGSANPPWRFALSSETES